MLQQLDNHKDSIRYCGTIGTDLSDRVAGVNERYNLEQLHESAHVSQTDQENQINLLNKEQDCVDESKEAVVIDGGGNVNDIWQILQKHEAKLTTLLFTHGHFDHIGGAFALAEKADNANLEIIIHKEDEYLWTNAKEQAGRFGIPLDMNQLKPTRWIEDEEMLNLAGIQLATLYTPGHSPGSCCFYLRDQGILISGDVLFQGSIGRTDLWKGNFETLIQSIRNKILTLPKETKIIPGHGPATTVGIEESSNPFLNEQPY